MQKLHVRDCGHAVLASTVIKQYTSVYCIGTRGQQSCGLCGHSVVKVDGYTGNNTALK